MAISTRAPHVVGVLGASGGLGASTLAVALAGSAVPVHPPVVCVDGHIERGGLDVTACVEHLPGVRWGDLAGVRGEVAVADLLRELPRAGGVPVLSAASGGAGPQQGMPYADFVDDRLHELVDDARRAAGVQPGSAEQLALPDAVRREPAWLPVSLIALAVLVLVVSFLL